MPESMTLGLLVRATQPAQKHRHSYILFWPLWLLQCLCYAVSTGYCSENTPHNWSISCKNTIYHKWLMQKHTFFTHDSYFQFNFVVYLQYSWEMLQGSSVAPVNLVFTLFVHLLLYTPYCLHSFVCLGVFTRCRMNVSRRQNFYLQQIWLFLIMSTQMDSYYRW